ncbi:hypothetical protein [Pantoea cypripedii]|uniref:Uncharacterized protein n=1 Tax=Pantoea cypripedii TaxID=55209 RepID=A0A1X1EMN0_PANCY|nr:hypothetical protein [Pantoea cypripedii]MBP2200554.1 hypothetical protein [Pantoea cypripedii]ORM90126.1 hypothetical protein HA50_26545 [Pantoea cypripedii]
MNTQNVNTATPESPKTWVNNPSITFISRKTSALIRLAKKEGDLLMFRAFKRLGIDAPDHGDELFAPQEAALLVTELAEMGGITTPAVYDMVRSVESLSQDQKSYLWREEYPENLPELAVFQAASAEKKAQILRSMKTAVPESADTQTVMPEIPGLSQALRNDLARLAALSTREMDEMEREELLYGTLQNMADRVCDTVTDWTRPRPVVPFSSLSAWNRAGQLALNLFGETGEAAWREGCSHLALSLMTGYAMYVADIA